MAFLINDYKRGIDGYFLILRADLNSLLFGDENIAIPVKIYNCVFPNKCYSQYVVLETRYFILRPFDYFHKDQYRQFFDEECIEFSARNIKRDIIEKDKYTSKRGIERYDLFTKDEVHKIIENIPENMSYGTGKWINDFEYIVPERYSFYLLNESNIRKIN